MTAMAQGRASFAMDLRSRFQAGMTFILDLEILVSMDREVEASSHRREILRRRLRFGTHLCNYIVLQSKSLEN